MSFKVRVIASLFQPLSPSLTQECFGRLCAQAKDSDKECSVIEGQIGGQESEVTVIDA